jgi:hypothetical protein
LLFIAKSRKYHPVVVLLHNDKWLKKISAKFHEVLKQFSVFIFDIVSLDISSNCRHFNGLQFLCPINATSFSYVFILQYPRVLHCRIVPIEKFTTLVALGRKNLPYTTFTKTFHGHATGGEYFHETFVRHHSNLTKYIAFILFL